MAERYINAAKDGFLDILREATRRDLNSEDDDGMTATLWAARNGNLAALRHIAGRGGDVDKSDYLGQTALHHAAMRGHMNVVSFLVEYGCNVYAVDNDLQSALEVAALHGRQEIVRFLDYDLGQRQAKNPRHAARQKEEAMKTAEHNVKRYEKLQDAAAKKRDKEQKKRQKKLEQKLNHVQDGSNADSGGGTKQKTSFFKTLTMRGKKSAPSAKNSNGGMGSHDTLWAGTTKYSDFTGTATVSSRKGGIASRIQKKQMEAAIRATETSGHRSLRASVTPDQQGFVGSTPDVMYVGSVHGTTFAGGKRQSLSADFFQKANIYKSRSEPDLLDSGVDSYNGDFDDYDNNNNSNTNNDDDDDNAPGIFNRPEFGKLAFLQKSSFLSTLQSLEDEKSAHANQSYGNVLPVDKRLSGDGEEGDKTSMFSETSASKSPSTHSANHSEKPERNVSSQLPWDQDELENLDDDDDDENVNGDELAKEMSALNMFLWSCGLASHLHIFSKEKVDLPLLMRMTDAEMKELGLPFGPRKKLREAVAKRQSVLDAPPSAMRDSYL